MFISHYNLLSAKCFLILHSAIELTSASRCRGRLVRHAPITHPSGRRDVSPWADRRRINWTLGVRGRRVASPRVAQRRSASPRTWAARATRLPFLEKMQRDKCHQSILHSSHDAFFIPITFREPTSFLHLFFFFLSNIFLNEIRTKGHFLCFQRS